ncbi:MAG: methionine--tRNA ligase [Cetobacterium somerae]|jgi:methionyl-tRNA synthetase|uniref:methionine--tRNA ligase n=1 Tax=Cetobacterium TaxID=180162 RepID=UPI00163C273C|nr:MULTISPECIES: methionine--tRNA ligase [Cetobacterium]MBC2853133.1 methionine--tRNA ligase [Cetobacterium sp. 2G large]MCQ9625421.1 methionine--tRNA ligase [Cetobacterium somerae]
MSKNFYVTTPIYYVNGDPHVGSAYTTIAADVLARYKKSKGFDVFFLTGTDEHGQKVEEAAKMRDLTPQAWTDSMAPRFIDMWKALDINYTDFIRTTEPRHKEAVKKIIKTVYDKGDIYKGEYEGKYCVSCETFVPENQIVNGNHCPDCGKELTMVKEESYFFKMSKYQDALLEHIESHPDFILPHSRKNEVVSFIKQGLQDLSISRNTFEWGIPIEFAPGHITYVWFDALTNYLTAVGYENNPELFDKFWNNGEVVHLLGKDILRFHAIIWPCMLLSAGIKLPNKIVAHGWWTSEGEKMSKSKGNVVAPLDEIAKYGVDAFRYCLMREVNFGNDGDYSTPSIVTRINSDLANDLGNLLNRTLGMYGKYFNGTIVKGEVFEEIDDSVKTLWNETVIAVDYHMNRVEFSRALEAIWKFISRMNKYVDETAPWLLIKDETKNERLATVMNFLVQSLYKVAVLTAPYMPTASQKIWNQLGFSNNILEASLESVDGWNLLNEGHILGTAEPIFPRLEVEKKEAKKDPLAINEDLKIENPIEIADFDKIDIQVVEILEASNIEGADKLLKFKVKTANEIRQIVSGIAKYYPTPSELVGKKVLAILNLPPVTLRGVLSQGMLLSSTEKKRLKLVEVDSSVKIGSKIK